MQELLECFCRSAQESSSPVSRTATSKESYCEGALSRSRGFPDRDEGEKEKKTHAPGAQARRTLSQLVRSFVSRC